jgi:hypothetical protein
MPCFSIRGVRSAATSKTPDTKEAPTPGSSATRASAARQLPGGPTSRRTSIELDRLDTTGRRRPADPGKDAPPTVGNALGLKAPKASQSTVRTGPEVTQLVGATTSAGAAATGIAGTITTEAQTTIQDEDDSPFHWMNVLNRIKPFPKTHEGDPG